MEPEDVTFQFLREITDDFSEKLKLGEGTFGVVYKGVTINGEDVAVKMLNKLSNSDLNDKQFETELNNLRKLEHQNIVQILGYCYETKKRPFNMPDGSKVYLEETHRALCFEYLDKGSLENYLHDELCGLDWHTRFKIIKGICEGLKYMHEELKPPIYHLDLKPDNILLDKDMVPKIADFGLSRIFDKESWRTTPNPYGTHGYQPPEYINRGEISGKFDIFSLGIIMIRIVSGSKGYPKCLDMPSDKFIDQVQNNWRKRWQSTCSSGSSLEAYCHQIVTCTQIALNCVEKDSQKRPNTLTILETLSETETHIDKIKRTEESKDIRCQHQNINLMTSPRELDIDDVRAESMEVTELIVGRTEEKRKIMDLLLNVMLEKIVILPIYGIGGIGKTTFARLIYNDSMFKHYSHVWVDVTQRFDLNKIHDSIISQLSEKTSQTDERHMIRGCTTKLLSGKKILIVLDDLWEDGQLQLKDLKDMIYHGDSNTIVLATTRSERVAEIICTNLEPYKISPLSDDMCWNIIKQSSDFEDRDDKDQLMGIGLEIAQKCGGVALAARSLGFTLRSMTFDQWMEVKNSGIWNEPDSKVSLPNHALASLKLSYSCMDPCLKECFTYCAIFPKGHKIVKNDLVYQWISLDYIKPTKLLSIMQLSEKYIVQLLGLSFFQHSVSPKDENKGVTFFTMHDLVHDLARSVMGDELHDTSKEFKQFVGMNCRYAFLADCSKPLNSYVTFPYRIRALHFLGSGGTRHYYSIGFSNWYIIRVLDLGESHLDELPPCIGQLKLLRYLNAPRIGVIPSCLTKLSKLIYLNLRLSSSYWLSALPESIGEMEALMYLDLSCCREIKKLPESIGEMGALTYLDLSCCREIMKLPESFGKLKSLLHLDLSYCEKLNGIPEALCSLTKLQHLNLSACGHLLSGSKELHEVIGELTRLRYLNLSNSLLIYEEIYEEKRRVLIDSILDKISNLLNLEHLNLSSGVFLTLPDSFCGLQKLHTLNLTGCSQLKELPKNMDRMVSLKFLIGNYGWTIPTKTSCISLPKFVVDYVEGEQSSSLIRLKYSNPTNLRLSCLENVKSTEEARWIELRGKQSLKFLTLDWTRGSNGYVEDMELLRDLVPPSSLVYFQLQGYNSVSFPAWLINATAIYLPHLVHVHLMGLSRCSSIPPLGELANLKYLILKAMPNIKKIDRGFCGDRRMKAFPRLQYLTISHMKNLEEWTTTYSCGECVADEFMFPYLRILCITRCPKLIVKPCPPRVEISWTIRDSDGVLLKWEESTTETLCSTSAPVVRTLNLRVASCTMPMHQWKLLYHLPTLNYLEIDDCRDLSCSPEVTRILTALPALGFFGNIQELPQWLGGLTSLQSLELDNCSGIQALPEQLGDCISLKKLRISNCKGITSLPESIQKLTSLEILEVWGWSELRKWCKLEENKTKIDHVKMKRFRY